MGDGGGIGYLFRSQWSQCIRICLCTNKVVIYRNGKKCGSNVKTNFSDLKIWLGKKNTIENYCKETLFWFLSICVFYVYNHKDSCLLDFSILCHNLLNICLSTSTPQVSFFSWGILLIHSRKFQFCFRVSHVQCYFQMQCFHVIYTFYLYSFTFLTITFQTYNNIGSKTKVLFTLYGKF